MSTAYDPFESTGDSDDEKSSQTPLPTDRDVVTAKDVLGTKTPPATNQDNSTREISLGRDWQEFETPDGRKYYHNPKLGQTQWRMPEEYKEFLRKEKEKERIEGRSITITFSNQQLELTRVRRNWLQSR
eukprot:TRINITY_DN2493_c0_g2_i4.p1 TRINITY_DN2493_c0_g2~~TRINITY_DN2493_c0_g2_i4.p1  ORF type:complete len:129 (+),score=24.31 TRINITY_DN2493_c0_g2_i4:103-489(+)